MKIYIFIHAFVCYWIIFSVVKKVWRISEFSPDLVAVIIQLQIQGVMNCRIINRLLFKALDSSKFTVIYIQTRTLVLSLYFLLYFDYMIQ